MRQLSTIVNEREIGSGLGADCLQARKERADRSGGRVLEHVEQWRLRHEHLDKQPPLLVLHEIRGNGA